MSFREAVDQLLVARIRPFYYKHLSRYVKAKYFDDSLCLLFSRRLNPDLKSLEKKLGRFFFETNEKEPLISILKKYYPETFESTLGEADLVLDHVFDLLGSGPVNLGAQIDWHRDFKTGYRWEKLPYKNIKTIIPDNDSDIKIPWELSRFQHLSTLGRAYWISGEEKYAKGFVSQLLDWVRSNPPRVGVNWYFSMEVAIRAVNWICAYFFFKDSPSFNREAREVFFKNLLIHQIHIYHNLECNFRLRSKDANLNGNHYAAGLVGLVFTSLLFPRLCSERLGRNGLRWLFQEIHSQINPDGVHHELSIGYHRLMTEFFLSVALIMMRNDRKVSQSVLDKIQQMLEFIVAYTKPDGSAPQVRDADNSRLLPFTDNPINDHRYLLNVGAVLFNRADFKAAAPSISFEALWWLGPHGFHRFLEIPKVPNKSKSRVFPNSGFAFMRCDSDYLICLSSRVGVNKVAGHGHNDALSFELFTEGRGVLVDPGTYVYTAEPEFRNLFRSTSYHNTVRIDGREINEFDKNKLFSIPEEANPRIERWVTKENYDLLVASHSGYQKLSQEVCHRRIFVYNKKLRYWKIIDHLLGEGSHHIEIFFHFAIGLIPEKDIQTNSVIITDNAGFKFALFMKNLSNWNIAITKGWISPSYGEKQRSWIVCFSKSTKLPLRTAVTLRLIK